MAYNSPKKYSALLDIWITESQFHQLKDLSRHTIMFIPNSNERLTKNTVNLSDKGLLNITDKAVNGCWVQLTNIGNAFANSLTSHYEANIL